MMTTPFLFLFTPGKAARAIVRRPVLWPALTLTCILGIMTLVVRWPETVDAVAQHLPQSASARDRSVVQTMLRDDLRLRCAIVPVVVSVKLAAVSFLVYVLGRIPLSARSPRFREVMVICAHAGFLLAVGELLAQIVGWNPLSNANGIPGMAWIVHGDGNYILGALLRSCNVLTLWVSIALALGLRVLFGGSSLRSFLVAFAAWGVSILANLWLIRVMHDALHLPV